MLGLSNYVFVVLVGFPDLDLTGLGYLKHAFRGCTIGPSHETAYAGAAQGTMHASVNETLDPINSLSFCTGKKYSIYIYIHSQGFFGSFVNSSCEYEFSCNSVRPSIVPGGPLGMEKQN